jgi:hypothetical protein
VAECSPPNSTLRKEYTFHLSVIKNKQTGREVTTTLQVLYYREGPKRGLNTRYSETQRVSLSVLRGPTVLQDVMQCSLLEIQRRLFRRNRGHISDQREADKEEKSTRLYGDTYQKTTYFMMGVFSGMWLRKGLITTEVSEEFVTSSFKVPVKCWI